MSRIVFNNKIYSSRVQKLNSLLLGDCKDFRQIIFNGMPVSVNEMYSIGQRGAGKGLVAGKKNFYLNPKVKEIRKIVDAHLAGVNRFKVSGTAVLVVVFHSPTWLKFINGEIQAEKKDADNFIKSLQDAIMKAGCFEDEAVWEVHIFKHFCKDKERTTAWIYDMGDEVEEHVLKIVDYNIP